MQLVTRTRQPRQMGDTGRRALVLRGFHGWEWVLNYPLEKATGDTWEQSPWERRPEIMALTLSSHVKPKTLREEGKQNLHLLRFLCWCSFVGAQLPVVLQWSDPPKVGNQDSRDLGEQFSFSTPLQLIQCNLSYIWNQDHRRRIQKFQSLFIPVCFISSSSFI